jgi:hypothetical protein
MPDYSKAKIYRIYCGNDEYIGSTTRPLSERMAKHRTEYKKGNMAITSRIVFDKHGVENCKIELIEDFPCERREQLDKREGEIQRERLCVNKYVAGRTTTEYYLENREVLIDIQKQYRERNKDNVDEYHRQHYLDNKDIYIENAKKYREQNKDKVAEYRAKYREKNKDKIAEYQRQYRERNKSTNDNKM